MAKQMDLTADHIAMQLLAFPETLGRDPRLFTYPKPSILDRLRPYFVAPTAVVKLPSCDVARYQEISEIGENGYKTAYAAGYRLVFIKATEGTSHIDPMYEWHYNHAGEAGFYIITYHFFADGQDGAGQAEFHLEVTRSLREALKGRTAVYNDNENRVGAPIITVSARRTKVLNFHNTIALEGLKHGEYCSPALWSSRMGNDDLTKYGDGWVAHWTRGDFTLPTGWTMAETKAHQDGVYPTYDWVQPIPGISGTVDHDWWLGDEKSLRDYLGYVDEPQPSHPHPEIITLVEALNDQVTAIAERTAILEAANQQVTTTLVNHEGRISVLEDENPPTPPTNTAVFTVIEPVANMRHITGWTNPDPPGEPRPIFSIHEPRAQTQKHFGDRIMGNLPLVLGNGGEHCYMCTNQPIAGVTLYFRHTDVERVP